MTITECTIEDLGAEGISIIDPLAADVLIADCVIGETGVEPTLLVAFFGAVVHAGQGLRLVTGFGK